MAAAIAVQDRNSSERLSEEAKELGFGQVGRRPQNRPRDRSLPMAQTVEEESHQCNSKQQMRRIQSGERVSLKLPDCLCRRSVQFRLHRHRTIIVVFPSTRGTTGMPLLNPLL